MNKTISTIVILLGSLLIYVASFMKEGYSQTLPPKYKIVKRRDEYENLKPTKLCDGGNTSSSVELGYDQAMDEIRAGGDVNPLKFDNSVRLGLNPDVKRPDGDDWLRGDIPVRPPTGDWFIPQRALNPEKYLRVGALSSEASINKIENIIASTKPVTLN